MKGLIFVAGLVTGLVLGIALGSLIQLRMTPAVAIPDPMTREVRYRVEGLLPTNGKLLVATTNGTQYINKVPFEEIAQVRVGDKLEMSVSNQSDNKAPLGFIKCYILSNGIAIDENSKYDGGDFVLCKGFAR